MDVSLVSKTGLPDDAIISIRSGAVRRQGAISGDKPFRFPQAATEGDCVVKVDIMQTIGSGYLVVRPGQNQGKQYEVKFSDGCSCEIEIKPADGSALAELTEETAAAAKTKQDAKAYLEGTGLLPFVQGVLQVVAKQQPQDAFAAMAAHFNSASDAAVTPSSGGPKAAPPSPKKSPASPKAAEVAEVVAEAPQEAAEPPPAEAAAEPAAPAEAASEEKPAEAKEEDIDDHKSDSDVDVQFTATVKGKDLNAAAVAAATEEKPAEAAEEKAAEAAEEKPAEASGAEAAEEKPAEAAAEAPAEAAAETPAEAVTETPAEAAAETPAQATEQNSGELQAAAGAEEEKPAEATGAAAEPPAEASA